MAEINSDGPVVEDATAGRGNNKPKKAGKKVPAEENLEKCPCGESQGDYWKITCIECSQMWHTICVGLKGLANFDKGQVEELLTEWVCPLCYVLPAKVLQMTGIINVGHKRDVGNEPQNNGGCGTRVIVQEEINKILPAIQKTIKDAIIENADIKEIKSFADIVSKRNESNEKAAKKRNEERLKEIKKQNTKVEEAIKENRMKLLADNLEKERRKRNVVITNIPESKEKDTKKKQVEEQENVMAALFLAKNTLIQPQDLDIEYVARAGPNPDSEKALNATVKPRGPRIVIVTMATPQLAEQLHNYRSGVALRETETGPILNWVNADLTQSERKANYDARELQRKIKADREKNARIPTRNVTISKEIVPDDTDDSVSPTDKVVEALEDSEETPQTNKDFQKN